MTPTSFLKETCSFQAQNGYQQLTEFDLIEICRIYPASTVPLPEPTVNYYQVGH